MAVQQRRNSKTRTAKRRTHYKLTAVSTRCRTKFFLVVNTTEKPS